MANQSQWKMSPKRFKNGSVDREEKRFSVNSSDRLL